jgi:hypothetical protein
MGRERAEEQRTQTEKKTLMCQEENRKARENLKNNTRSASQRLLKHSTPMVVSVVDVKTVKQIKDFFSRK